MAAHDSGVDTSNDSNSAIEMSINLRQMENSIKDYVALMQADLNTDPTTTAGTSYKVPKTPHFAQERCERNSGAVRKRNVDGGGVAGPDAPYSSNFPKERKLRLASSICNTELLNRILETGVNPDAADEHLRSPLHLAASRGYTTIVKALLNHGANPNVQDTLGNTPLHLAVCSASSYNFNLVVRLLLQHGCNVTITDRSGKTALDLAKSKLLLMRTRLGQNSTSESALLFVEMSMLTGLLHRTMSKQMKDVKQFDDLEARLRNLTTKEIEDGADQLLADVAGLNIK